MVYVQKNTRPFAYRILEASRAELAGAERRLALAKQSLEDFWAENDGKAVSRELALSLAHQRDALEREIDESLRRAVHCREEIQVLELAEGVEADTLAGRILGLPEEADEGEAQTRAG